MTEVAFSRVPGSPGSSPRLPSPPPMPEFQFGPQSPSATTSTNELQSEAPNQPDETAQRRIRPGTKAVDMAKGPPLVPLIQLDSAFQLQEHLKSIYAQYTHGQSAAHTVPIMRDTALQIATPPQLNDGESVDKNLWLYELCRFLTMKANLVSVALMADSPPCSAITCPEMRASEWQYLCAVHEPPKSCCAIDYVNHTLDWAANVLTSTKHFPSRLQLGGETGNVFQSMRQLTNIFRRVYRIFAHAWFQHREVFWHIESTYGIYMLFKSVCDKYQLIPEDNYTVPPEAEGMPDDAETPVNTSDPDNEPGLHILRKDASPPSHQNGHETPGTETTVSTGATTRRHKHTPSTGSHVATIAEGTEEDDENSQTLSQTTQIAIPLLSSSSPPKPSKPAPERATHASLGRLNIADTVSTYIPSNPEDPTPTTATSDKDPLSAAKLAGTAEPQDPAAESSTSTSALPSAPTTTKPIGHEGTSSPSKPQPQANVNVKLRRDSGLESEIRSPGGGSFRTSGSDILSAVLGHIEGYQDVSESGTGDDGGGVSPGEKESGIKTGEDGRDEQLSAKEDEKHAQKERGVGAAVTANTTAPADRESSVNEQEVPDSNETKSAPSDIKTSVTDTKEDTTDLEDGTEEKDDADDDETMEEIRLTDRDSASPRLAGEGKQKQEAQGGEGEGDGDGDGDGDKFEEATGGSKAE